MKMFNDVYDFHKKFDLPTGDTFAPQPLPNKLKEFRSKFLQEELDEFKLALESDDIIEQIDGLLDLVYVAHGTLQMMGLPAPLVEACWNDIQRSNMSKVRAEHSDDIRSKRKNSFDVVKPDDFVPPRIKQILEQYGVDLNDKANTI